MLEERVTHEYEAEIGKLVDELYECKKTSKLQASLSQVITIGHD